MDLKTISKAIAGALAAGAGGLGTSVIAVPDGVVVPWWGYVLIGVLNAALGFAVVYIAPKNTVAK